MPYRHQHHQPMSAVDQLLAVLFGVVLFIFIGGTFIWVYFG